MKKIALAAAIALTSTSAFAGSVSDVEVEPPVIATEAASSSAAGIWVPLVLIAVVAAVVAAD